MRLHSSDRSDFFAQRCPKNMSYQNQFHILLRFSQDPQIHQKFWILTLGRKWVKISVCDLHLIKYPCVGTVQSCFLIHFCQKNMSIFFWQQRDTKRFAFWPKKFAFWPKRFAFWVLTLGSVKHQFAICILSIITMPFCTVQRGLPFDPTLSEKYIVWKSIPYIPQILTKPTDPLKVSIFDFRKKVCEDFSLQSTYY